MGALALLVYGGMMLAAGGGIGATVAGIWYARRLRELLDEAPAAAPAMEPIVPLAEQVQRGTLAEHRRWLERQTAAAPAPAKPEYEARHRAGIAPGTDAQRLAVTVQVEEWRSLDVTGELDQILAEAAGFADPVVIESPAELAAWMAQTHQPWWPVDQFEEVAA